MAHQLNIRSDEAYGLAHDLARRLEKPVSEVVLQALRELGAKLPEEEGMTPAQQAEYEALRALARRTAKHKKPGATSDHSDMYDDVGLSK